MAHRVSTYKYYVLMTGGAHRVTSFKLLAFLSRKEPLRVSTFKALAYITRAEPLRVSTWKVTAWTSLDQGIYLTNEVFGSNEVFTPDFSNEYEYDAPDPPQIEVNPFRADVPNVDQQRILREQHNLTQAGDSTFHWGVLTEVSATPLYNLGSVGRFYHDEFGISIARYVKFTSMVKTAAKAVPVGLNRKLNQHWTVTNQLELSDKNSVMGIACPYNELVYSGSWYGWVIVDGFVPAELDVVLGDSIFEWATEYTWGETGKVVPNGEGDLIGIRFTTSNVPNLKPGELLVKVSDWSLTKLTGLITTSLGPVGEQLNELTSEVNALTATSTTHTQQIGQLQSQVVGLDNRITKESEATARQLAAIRSLMPDVDFKSYVDSQVEMLTIKIDTQDGIIGEIANNALAKVNELELKFEAISNQSLQVQIDSINNALGSLTGRLVGFTTQIDTTTLTAGQVLISTDAGLTPGGTQLYDFQPIDFKFANLLDVDVTTPPADGQVPIWDNTASKWIPGNQSGGGGGGGGGFSIHYFTLTNPGAETGDTSGWTVPTGSANAVTSRGGAVPYAGTYMFESGAAALTEMYQDVDISAYATEIDAGTSLLYYGAAITQSYTVPELGGVAIEFYDGSSTLLEKRIYSMASNDTNADYWELVTGLRAIPATARTARFFLILDRNDGTNNDVCADDAFVGIITSGGGGGGSLCATLSRTTDLAITAVPVIEIPWQVADIDDAGFWDAGQPSRITIPIGSGIQRVRLALGICPDTTYAAGATMLLSIFKNGDSSTAGRVVQLSARADGFAGLANSMTSGVIPVAEGDYFEARINTAGDTSFTISATPSTYFSIESIS